METDEYISQKVRQEYDKLMNVILPFAQKMLKKHGAFYPFGAAMRDDGSIELNAGYDGTEHPHTDEILSILMEGIRAKRDELTAAGICMDTTVQITEATSKRDAILICLDHSKGRPMDLCVPYRKGFLRRIRFGQVSAAEGSIRLLSNKEKENEASE